MALGKSARRASSGCHGGYRRSTRCFGEVARGERKTPVRSLPTQEFRTLSEAHIARAPLSCPMIRERHQAALGRGRNEPCAGMCVTGPSVAPLTSIRGQLDGKNAFSKMVAE